MRIGIDIDGVCYPWVQAVNEAVMDEFGVPDPGDHQYWNWLKEKLTPDQWQWVWSDDAAERVFGRMDLIFPGTVDAVSDLIRHHEVHFVTHRNPERTAGWTGRWLAKWFTNYAGVHVLHNSVRKVDVLKWDVFIDDKPETVEEMLLAGVRTFMPVRVYNLSFEPPVRHIPGDYIMAPYDLPTDNIFNHYHDWEEVTWGL